MISADLESLRLAHDKSNLSGLFVLQKLHTSNPSLLPLVPFPIKPIELRLTTTNTPLQLIKIQKKKHTRNSTTLEYDRALTDRE